MDFLQHTINWVKGEIFEATIFGSFGLVAVACGLLLWKFGETPNARALVIPVIVVGLVFSVTAISGISNNKKRLLEYTAAYSKDKPAFVQSEKARVEGFQYLYKMTTITAAISFALAISAFVFTYSTTLRAVGIALAIFGITGMVIDYFSKERADNYYKVITTALNG